MPFGGALTASLIGAGGSILGGLFGGGGMPQVQKDLLKQEKTQQAEQFKQMMATYNQLAPFYQQYLQQGSPFLQNIQRAGAEQTAQQFGNAAGQFRNQMQTTGMGYGPSGATAAGLAGLGTAAASTGAANYLQNLLANENLKFNSAAGLGNIMGAIRPGQPATTNVGYVPPGTGGAIQGAGNALQGLFKAIQGQSGGGVSGPLNTPGGLPLGGLPSGLGSGLGLPTGGVSPDFGGAND